MRVIPASEVEYTPRALDLCAFDFPSEKLRTDRLQVNYERSSTSVSISNEVVTYRPGKAAQAIAEARYAATHCPTAGRVSPYFGGPPATFRLTMLADSRLPSGYVALHAHVATVVKGQREEITSIAIYQVRGDVVSIVYVYPGKGTTAGQLQQAAFHAAEAVAHNLALVA